MELRTNQEFTIIDSIVVGNGIEYVVGQRDTDFEPYVVWECIGGNEYRQGEYCSDASDAKEYMRERAVEELKRQRAKGKLPPAWEELHPLDWTSGVEMTLRPMKPEEQKYAFPQSQQLTGQCGNTGRYHGGFKSKNQSFEADWEYRGKCIDMDVFKNELHTVVDALVSDARFGNLLKRRATMEQYCARYYPDSGSEQNDREYFFRADTKEYAYLLRCDPAHSETNFRIYAYVAKWLDRHIEKASQGIRFIDSRYNELFRIRDGESIIITDSSGSKHIRPCRFIDETHTEVGSGLYHICQFAELAERAGSTYEPDAKPDTPENNRPASRKRPNYQQER